MRILQVIHQFPPFSSQGSEVYCAALAGELASSDEVSVFHVSSVPAGWRRRLDRTRMGSLDVWHCVDRGEYARLATWPNEFLRRSFRHVLDEVLPEIVHFHNFLSLGDDLVGSARAAGSRVVYTLHDYGLVCPNAILLRDDGMLCGKQDPDFFQDCCPLLIRTAGASHPPWSARLPSLARWILYARQHAPGAARRVLLAWTGAAVRWWGDPRESEVARKRTFFLGRTRALFEAVDLFLAPSEFLKRRVVSGGVPAGKVVTSRYGMRRFPVPARGKEHADVRFGYIGALHTHKGIELLLDAFGGLGENATLHVHGSTFGSPISERFRRRLESRADARVVFHGAYDNGRVGEILSRLDVVVVPSLWYENWPLTIQEAFLAGVPVVTADVGGMAEAVRDGVDGLLFRHGDAADLRRAMQRIARDPTILERLRRGIPEVPGIEAHAAEIRAHYRRVVGERT